MSKLSLDRFAVSYPKGGMIFCESEHGDTFYLIQHGRVQITKIIGAIEKTLDVLNPGELFGEMAILENAPRSASAIALDAVTLLEFTKQNFELILEGNPEIALRLMKLFSKRIYDQRRRFMILRLPNIHARVADVFLMLDEAQGRPEDDDKSRTFQTTPEDVAHWAGISKEEGRIAINQFAKQRKIEVLRDKIIVHNIHDFSRYVSSQRKAGA